MQATYEEQQNTLGWYRARLGNITGSAVGNLMGSARSKSAEWSSTAESYIQQLAFERTMDADIVSNDMLFAQYIELTNVKSKAIEWGHKQEGNAADLFATNFQPLYEPNAEYFKLSLEEPPSVKSKELPHFASSPDRMFANPVTGEECCVEIKSPQGKSFSKYAAITLLPTQDERLEALKKAEPNYYWQIFAHMLATGTSKCYWVIFNPFSTNPLYTMQVERDEDIINELRDKIVKADQYIEQFVAKLKEAAHKESFPAAEAKEDNGTVRPLGADANCSHATTMTQKNSSQSGTDNPSSSPSQKQEASDSTESISPSSAQHGNALTEGGESASAKNLDNFRRILTLLARFSDQVYRPATSEWVEVPRSISFERILKQSSGSSTMPHSTSCATSSCPKQTEDGTHSLTNSQDSECLALSKSRCKELARLYSSALALMWGNNNVLTKQGLEEILSITEYHLEKHKRESTTYENQLRLAKDFRKRMLHDGTN